MSYFSTQCKKLELNLIYKIVLLQFKSDGTGGWTFTCQHGPEECEGNLYQVCLLDKLAVNSVQVEAVHCMMADEHPDQATKKVKNLIF